MSEEKPVRLFVSHHSSKADVAARVEQHLNARGITCWIAPRDVPPGAPFDRAIQEAIRDCAGVLLLFCANSDKSRHVKRELILGDTAGRPIIPLRLEAIDPGELAYHLADSQWIDWIDRREAVMDRVAAQARLFAGAVSTAPVAQPVADRGNASRRNLVIGAVAAVLLLAVAGTWLFMRGDELPRDEETMAAVEASPTPIIDTPAGDEIDAAELAAAQGATAAPPPVTTQPVSQPVVTPVARPTSTPTPAPQPAAAAPLQRVIDGCRGAPTDTEYLICANPPLDARAREIGALITSVREAYTSAGVDVRSFNNEQRNWFNGVKARCHSLECVEAAQFERMGELRAILDRAGG